MKFMVFCIRDRAANCFGTPFFTASRGMAIRTFADSINNQSTDVLFKHPEDFDLYELGCYFDETGKFVCNEPVQVSVGKDLKVANGA